MRATKYPSDVTDEQWALIRDLIPVYPGGRPRKTDLRDVVDAVFYVLRTGCQWRYLPKDFPPKSTAWRYFDEWRHNGTLDTIHDTLRKKVRTQEKPYSPRTTASVDSQSVDTTSGGEQRGRDNAKNVDGRKRHIIVDSMGLLLAVLVTAADVDDAKAAALVFARLEGQPMSRVGRMFADSKYHNHARYSDCSLRGAVLCQDHRHATVRPSPMSSSPRLDDSQLLVRRRRTFDNEPTWCCFCTNIPRHPMSKSLPDSTFIPIASAVGGN